MGMFSIVGFDVRGINSVNPWANTVITVPPGPAITPEQKEAAVKRAPIEERLRNEVLDASMKARIDAVRAEYAKQIAAESLDGTFKKALDLYKSIEESTDDEETKAWKTNLLDDVVKNTVLSYAAKLNQKVSMAGIYQRAPDKEKEPEDPEAGNALRLLEEGLLQNAEQIAAFLDLVEAQELASDADIAELLNPEAEDGLLDPDALESATLNSLLEQQTRSLSEREESKLSKEIKTLERKNESEYRDAENEAFWNAYQSDPERAAELQPDDVGVEMASFAMALGITNSAKRLALDFLSFVRENPNGSYEELESHLNRNSGKRDLNRLSLADFMKLGSQIDTLPRRDEKDPNRTPKALADLVNWYSDTVYNRRLDEELDRLWMQNTVSSGVYDRYGRMSKYDMLAAWRLYG